MTHFRPIGSVQCATCAHFKPDSSNPAAAMGDCLAAKGYWFAGEWHLCDRWKQGGI